MSLPPPNLHRHDGAVPRTARERRLGQRGTVVWFTGLSGSGKSTLARAVEERLHGMGHLVYVLDGDNVRLGLCRDLGFSAADRTENIRRIAHVAALFADCGVLVLTAFVSPFRADRDLARGLLGDAFVEVFVDAPLPTCEQRDPKGLYRRARAGTLRDFTGIDSPYEPPLQPELRLASDRHCVDELAAQLITFLAAHGRLQAPPEAS